MSQQDEATKAPRQTEAESQPNLFALTGTGIQVTYQSTGMVGSPSFTYQDAHLSKTFTGDEMRVVEAGDIRIVTVSIARETDTGYTSFSLVVPGVHLSNGTPAPIATIGITSTHRRGNIPFVGQLDTFSAVDLTGSAAFVEF